MDKELFIGLDKDLHELTNEEQEIWFETWFKDLIDLDQLEKDLGQSKSMDKNINLDKIQDT